MSIEFYKIVHVVGILGVIAGLAALWGVSTVSGKNAGHRKALALIHGFGMTLVLISGFGMLARLGLMTSMPGWIYAKIVIWLFLGASMVLAKRRAHLGVSLILGWIILGGVAATLAFTKPF